MVEPVRRDIDIKIEEVTSGDGTATGGLIEEVIYVSEGAELQPVADRDGTLEHPYATLAEAMADPRFGNTAFTIHIINDNLGDGWVPGDTIATDNILLWGCGSGHPTYGGVTGMTGGCPTINDTVVLNANNLRV